MLMIERRAAKNLAVAIYPQSLKIFANSQ